MHPLLWIVLSLVVLYGVLLFGVAYGTLHPLRVPIFLSPGALGLPQESVSFTSADGVPIRGWWVDRPDAETVVVLAHGFLMNRAEGTPLAKKLYEEGCACLLFDFRRHGSSGGKQSTIGWAERLDVQAAFAEAKRKYPASKVVLWGSSMGGAATVFAVAHESVTPDAIILDSAYSRLIDANAGWWKTFVGPAITPFLIPTWVFCWAMTRIDPRKVDVARDLAGIKVPVLMLYGDKDLIVPPEAARRNHQANPDMQIEWFAGVQHSQPRWVQTDKYDELILQFLLRHGVWAAQS